MYKKRRICATIEARLAASRLPGKVLFPLCEKTVLEHIVNRIRQSQWVDEVIVATTKQREDAAIQSVCQDNGILCTRGSVDNILSRIIAASEGFDIVVQATGDNPFIDASLVDHAIEMLIDQQVDYVGNHTPATYPLGLDVRVMTREALLKTQQSTNDPIDLVHGSYYIYSHPKQFKLACWQAPSEQCYPNLRLTLDEAEDFILIKSLYQQLYPTNPNFNLADILQIMKDNPSMSSINQHISQKAPQEG